MASSLEYERLIIEGALGMNSLTSFYMNVSSNTHARAKLTGYIRDDSEVLAWQQECNEQKATVYVKEGSTKKTLFDGYIMDAGVEYVDDLKLLTIELVSVSIYLDREIKRRSFQDVSKTYAVTIKEVIDDGEKTRCSYNSDEMQKPAKPLIQYAETDWQFVKRLASHLGTVVFPDVESRMPNIWVGLPIANEKVSFDESMYYVHGISSHFYELGGKEAGLSKGQFEFYRVTTYTNAALGGAVEFKGKSWYIVEKSAEIRKGEVVFIYTLGKEEFIKSRKEYNPVFAGMSILGNIIEVNGEKVKLHLEIDKQQDASSAYPYLWTPDTGSVMYCMPETGTTVSLYFSDQDEFTAKAVNCVRHNGESCSKMSDTSKRTLTTDSGKNMYLYADSVGFDIEDTGLKFDLADEEGVAVTSAKTITIYAEDSIKLTGKNVYLDTPNEIVIARM